MILAKQGRHREMGASLLFCFESGIPVHTVLQGGAAMYVNVTGESCDRMVLVMGEPLDCHTDGHYLLPGRLVKALKPDDLPIGIGFSLAGALPSGYGFYREDSVVFRRPDDSLSLLIEVTSTYEVAEWDGLFPLEATLLARKQVIEEHKDFACVNYESSEEVAIIRYEFSWSSQEENDLEHALEAICDTVFEVEARGNAQLWPGRGRHMDDC